MRKDGSNFICDRCGHVEFVEGGTIYIGEGGIPFCWSEHDGKQLCETCTEAYNTMMNNFYAPVVKRPLDIDDSKREVVNGRTVL